jgi:hypothetical protein
MPDHADRRMRNGERRAHLRDNDAASAGASSLTPAGDHHAQYPLPGQHLVGEHPISGERR